MPISGVWSVSISDGRVKSSSTPNRGVIAAPARSENDIASPEPGMSVLSTLPVRTISALSEPAMYPDWAHAGRATAGNRTRARIAACFHLMPCKLSQVTQP